MTEPQEDPPDALQRDQIDPSIKTRTSDSPSPITSFAALTLSSDETTYGTATDGVYTRNTTAKSSANRPRLNEISPTVQPSPEFEGPPIRRQVELDHDVEIRDESAREGLSESAQSYSIPPPLLPISVPTPRQRPISPPPRPARPLDSHSSPLPFSRAAPSSTMLAIPADSPPLSVHQIELEEKRPHDQIVSPTDSSTIKSISPLEFCQLLEKKQDVVLIDTRNLESFLESRVIYSINVSFPTLLCKRLSNRTGKSFESFKLEDFITTSLGKKLYRSLEGRQVIIIDDRMHQQSTSMNPGRVLLSVLEQRNEAKGLYYLDRELGEAAKGEEKLRKWVVWGENDSEGEGTTEKEEEQQTRSQLPLPRSRASLCKLDTSSTLLAPHSRPGVASAAPVSASIPASIESPTSYDQPGGGISRKAPPPRLNLGSLKTADSEPSPRSTRQMSIHETCRLQAKSPSAQATRFSEAELALPSTPSSFAPPTTEDSPPPFEPSTIIPDFLYLGQEPNTPEDFLRLASLGITEVLNLAIECRPLEKDQEIDERGQQDFIERYWYLPIRDSIEETGVQGVLEKGCRILDDAKLRGRKVYVHCFLGRSRSCMMILAYLMHTHHWPLQRAYNYVAARRAKISPNLGFMAELMSFEERLNSIKVPSTTSLHRSKSASVQPTRSSALLLSSPITPTAPVRKALERGTSDLGPSLAAAASTATGKNASRAVRSILATHSGDSTPKIGIEESGSSTSKDRWTFDSRAMEQENQEITSFA